MTPAQRKAVAEALTGLKAQLQAKAPRKLEPTRTDEARVGADEDDQPLAEMEQAIASNRNKNDALMLARVEAALARLKADPDDFGHCLDCGDPIAAGRLKAMPYVELCIECQSKKDAAAGGPRRKHLTDFV